MDPQTQERMAQARAAGYSDEEIQQYLATENQPLEQAAPNKRTEEYMGMGQFGLAKAAELGLEGYGGYKIAKGLIGAAGNAVRGPVAPVAAPAPTTFTGGANPAFDAALSQPHPQATPLVTAPPTADNFISRIEQLAAKYAAPARAIGSNLVKYAGPAMAVGANLYGTSPEEIATLKAAEQRRRQASMNSMPR
jgi:hypothetical protein